LYAQNGNRRFFRRSRDSSDGIATSYGLDSRGSIPGSGNRFSILHNVQTGSEAHPASYPVGIAGCFSGIKRPGRESDHSPPFSTKVRNDGAIPHPPYVFMA
jgi:hypothetical protein